MTLLTLIIWSITYDCDWKSCSSHSFSSLCKKDDITYSSVFWLISALTFIRKLDQLLQNARSCMSFFKFDNLNCLVVHLSIVCYCMNDLKNEYLPLYLYLSKHKIRIRDTPMDILSRRMYFIRCHIWLVEIATQYHSLIPRYITYRIVTSHKLEYYHTTDHVCM